MKARRTPTRPRNGTTTAVSLVAALTSARDEAIARFDQLIEEAKRAARAPAVDRPPAGEIGYAEVARDLKISKEAASARVRRLARKRPIPNRWKDGRVVFGTEVLTALIDNESVVDGTPPRRG